MLTGDDKQMQLKYEQRDRDKSRELKRAHADIEALMIEKAMLEEETAKLREVYRNKLTEQIAGPGKGADALSGEDTGLVLDDLVGSFAAREETLTGRCCGGSAERALTLTLPNPNPNHAAMGTEGDLCLWKIKLVLLIFTPQKKKRTRTLTLSLTPSPGSKQYRRTRR